MAIYYLGLFREIVANKLWAVSSEAAHNLLLKQTETYLPNRAYNTPAATAEPITPATFGPIACINR